MNVLIIGSGGREHAIAWKVAQSSRLSKLYVLPGNPGTAQVAENVGDISVDDHAAIVRFCQEKNIDIVVVGPEAPLACGLGDDLRTAGLRVFGPNKNAAEIESSKVFAKEFMARHNIPTARFATFTDFHAAVSHLKSIDYPVVIKASGLAAGKGVLLPETLAEAESVLRQVMVAKEFGAAGDAVVIEERMSGPEVSLLAFTDGVTIKPLLPSQDHKRVFDGDQGPNTGGMGAYTPLPVCPPSMVDKIMRTIMQPAVDGLRAEGRPFVGLLYGGLMLTEIGPSVIEFNCRFGDPETQVVLPMLESDLIDIVEACIEGRLAEVDVRLKSGSAACVVLTSGGYPGKYSIGLPIFGFDQETGNTIVLHSGTKLVDGQVVTAGGRVLCVTGYGENIFAALNSAYERASEIKFDGKHFRADIGWQVFQSDRVTDRVADLETEKRITDDETEKQVTDYKTGKRIADGRGDYGVSKLVRLPTDELTYKVNGLAMKVHNELRAGHAEKFYQRRLADLCQQAGLAVEMEKRVEVWIDERMLGYLKLDLWIDERLIVECKSFAHELGKDDIGQVLTYLAATGSQVGMLYNFGRFSLDMRRILAPSEVKEWQQYLYRFIHKKPGMVLPPLDSNKTNVPPIRFKVFQEQTKLVEIPSPSGAAIRLSASQSVTKSVDYASAGVNIDAGNRAVELMKDAVKSTYTPAVLAGIGSFGGLFDISDLKNMTNPVLVASTDGVGTKVKLAAEANSYRSIGHDIVNHCIDDILVQGARPLFFMDYFATSKLDPAQTAEVVTGIAEACKESGLVLLGGETAEMPGVYASGEFDVAGTIVGILERGCILPRSDLAAGDVLVGLTSSGPHTNGYSLIRKVFEGVPLDTVYPELGLPLSKSLLEPHRSYLNVLHPYLGYVKALAHLTGGGFIENIPRILPANLDAVVDTGSWQIPPLFRLIQECGNISKDEMFRVFNMGIGMVAIVDKDQVDELQKFISEPTFIIGVLAAGSHKVILK